MAKILVVRPRPGSLKSLFSKLAAIHSKNGPFDLTLLLSDLFLSDGEGSPEAAAEVDELLDGKMKVPPGCWCMMGGRAVPEKVRKRAEEKGGEVCENLTMMDPVSVTTLKTLGGLRLGCFSGTFDTASYSSISAPSLSLASPNITRSHVSAFTSRLSSSTSSPHPLPIDILLTHSLPQLLTLHSLSPPTAKDPSCAAWGCAPVTEAVKTSRPRYIFGAGGVKEGGGVFWEREPWIWEAFEPVEMREARLARFVSLGEFQNKAKERWFYAFNILPLFTTSPISPPPNATPSPYVFVSPSATSRGAKRSAFEDLDIDFDAGPDFRFGNGGDSQGRKKVRGSPPAHYTCNICHQKNHWIQECPQRADKAGGGVEVKCHTCQQVGHKAFECPMVEQGGGRKKGKGKAGPAPVKEIAPDNCWFCLSNPQVTKHLIASIGSETYVTLPKGQLPDTAANSPVPGGGHVLLIPIAHYPSLASLPPALAVPTISELETYKSALRACYSSFNASLVTFEVSKITGPGGRTGHAHVQCCPIPNSLADKVEDAFRVEGERVSGDGKGYFRDEDEFKGGMGREGERVNYFRVGLPDGRTLVHVMKSEERFNLQFGRIALANLLGMPQRADWKAASTAEGQERVECAAFKKAFAKFEPNFVD